jgi:hypothetical protein
MVLAIIRLLINEWGAWAQVQALVCANAQWAKAALI